MLTGKVINTNNEILQYANVYVSDAQGKPLYMNNVLKGTTTNANGLFSLNIENTGIYVTASYTGHERETKLITNKNQFVEFKLKTTTLSEVEIKAKRINNNYLLAAIAALILLNS